MLVSGCATYDPNYYTNPNSPGYNEPSISGLCEMCNRVFTVSRHTFDTSENVQCCYCGHVQNLKMAVNRYAYLQQQQEAQANQQMLQNLGEAFNTYNRQQAVSAQNAANQISSYGQQMYLDSRQKANQQGTYSNPIYIKKKN